MRLRFLTFPDAWRRSGNDEIARLQRHVTADIGNRLRDSEDHGLRIARLFAFAIDVEKHVQVLRVRYLVRGHKPGADRTEGVVSLALAPLRAALLLVETFGNVVDEYVAGNVGGNFFFRNMRSAMANDHAQFHLPIRMRGVGRQYDIVVRAGKARYGLHKGDRLRRNGKAGFARVVGIIQADSDDLWNAFDRYAIAHILIDEGQ